MNRIDGFLDLDSYFENLKKEHNWEDIDLFFESLVVPSEYAENQFWLNVDGQKYYFKCTRNIYEELIASECAKFLDIPAVPYDLAVFKGIEGVISQSFKKEDADYITGTKILYDYFIDFDNRETLYEMGFDITAVEHCPNVVDIAESMQTLEIVWQALEYRYKDEVVVEKIMNGLIGQFMLNILLAQEDGDPLNWEIEEDIDGVRLVPYYDGGECLNDPDEDKVVLRMAVSFKDKYKDNYQILESFLKTSSDEFITQFLEYYEKLDLYNFMKILSEIEKKIGRPIPSYARRRILESFSDNREGIEYTIKRSVKGKGVN